MAAEPQLHFSREELLTPNDVARILRVQRTTAIGYMRRGVVPAAKIGRRWYSSKPLLEDFLEHLFESGPDS
jgi:hypothetical protein